MIPPEETEKKIQGLLYQTFYRTLLLIPNIKLFKWESDIIGISKNGSITEFEIKLTHEDFIRDFEKPKHKKFRNASKTSRIPSRIYFVCPSMVIQPTELPPYAGLIWSDSMLTQARTWEQRRAPVISNYRIDSRHLRRALVSVASRYWLLRGQKEYYHRV